MKKLLLTLAGCAMTLGAFAEVPSNANVLASYYDGSGNQFWGWGADFEYNVQEDGYTCVKLTNEKSGNFWDVQMGPQKLEFEDGVTYYIDFMVKGTPATGLSAQIQNASYSYLGTFSTYDVTEEWKNVTIEATCDGEGGIDAVFNFGTYIGTLYMSEVVVYSLGEPGDNPGVEQPETGVPSNANVIATYYDGKYNQFWSWAASSENTGEGNANSEIDGKPCFEYTNEVAHESWENWMYQACLHGLELYAGTEYYVNFSVKGTPAKGIQSFFTGENGDGGNLTTFNVTEDWTSVTIKGTPTVDGGENADGLAGRVIINLGAYVGTLYITDVTVYTLDENGDEPGTDEPGSIIPEGLELLAAGDTADGVTFVEWSDKLNNTEVDGVECVEYVNDAAGDSYSVQFAIDLNFQENEVYYISFDVMGDPSETAISAWYQYKQTYSALGYNDFNSFKVNSDSKWTNVVLYGKYTASEATPFADRVVINLGEYVGTMYMTNFKVYGPAANDDPSGVEKVETTLKNITVYNLNGVKVLDTDNANALNSLRPGIYVVNGKKVVIK